MPALALLLAGAGAHAECTKDLDCAGEQICEEGKCVEASASAPVAPTTAAPPAAPPAVPRVLAPPRVIAVDSPPPAPASQRYGMRSPGLSVAGTIAVSAGVAIMLYGLATAKGPTCYHQLADDFKNERCDSNFTAIPYIVGGGLVVLGAPLIVVGAMRVPKLEARVTPWISPQSGGLALRLTL